MSLARRSETCDVYIYKLGNNTYTCSDCCFSSLSVSLYIIDLMKHLALHQKIGDKVPKSVIHRVAEELFESYGGSIESTT